MSLTFREKAWFSFWMVIIGMFIVCYDCGCGATNKIPENLDTGGGDAKISQKATQNNPWPWMIALVISNIAWPVLIFLYLYTSKKYLGFGRK